MATSLSAVHVTRWTGTLGVTLPAVGTIVYPIWSFPATQTSGADVARWATTHHDRLIATQALYTVGVALWLVFGATLTSYLQTRLPEERALVSGFTGGFGGLVILILCGFTAFNILLYLPRSAELSTLLYDLTFGLLAISGIPTAVALGSFAIAVYRHRVLPRSTADLGVVAAVAHLLLLFAFVVHDGPLSLQGFAITWAIPILLFAWILRTALAMPRTSD